MGKSIPFSIATRSFASKEEAILFFRLMLNRYSIGDVIIEGDAADLLALLEKHTDSVAKIGRGVDHFKIIADGYGKQCFSLVRIDGTTDDFSYLHCIRPRADRPTIRPRIVKLA